MVFASCFANFVFVGQDFDKFWQDLLEFVRGFEACPIKSHKNLRKIVDNLEAEVLYGVFLAKWF